MPTLHILTALVYSFFLFAFTAASGRDHNLEARKAISHNLECGEYLPVLQSWPDAAPPRASFQTLVDLCGWVVNQQTAGCVCDYPYVRVECREAIANPVLYQTYRTYCLNNCVCAGSALKPGLILVAGSNRPPPLSPFEAARIRAGLGNARRSSEVD
ncbi:MAG: hypothetical protein M1830_002679 [Pleopsidium flavum]|nr:MAG: hypothetical protein M1830_002679 [Pleopsidium flavum]